MGQGIAQIAVFLLVLVAAAYLFGIYMARVFADSTRDRRLDRAFFRLLGERGAKEQTWKEYATTLLVFSLLFAVVLYGIQRLQGHLFLNPQHVSGVPSHLSFNTAISFVTNTNWQFYAGESTMSFFTQMAGLAVQNFVSAGVGLAVMVAVFRGFSRRSAQNSKGTVNAFCAGTATPGNDRTTIVTFAVSWTGGLTPSSAVSVAVYTMVPPSSRTSTVNA